jgi:hypothetical protein
MQGCCIIFAVPFSTAGEIGRLIAAVISRNKEKSIAELPLAKTEVGLQFHLTVKKLFYPVKLLAS